jgi:hypothetical protein
LAENGEAVCLSQTSNTKTENAEQETLTPFGRAFYKRQANYFVIPYSVLFLIQITVVALSAAYWSIGIVSCAQVLRQLQIHMESLHLFRRTWYRFGIMYGIIAAIMVIVFTLQAILAMVFAIAVKWATVGQRYPGRYDWDKSSYCQRWKLQSTLSYVLSQGDSERILEAISGSAYIVWFFRAMGAKIGRNCGVFTGGEIGFLTEPDLVEVIIFPIYCPSIIDK